MRSLLTEKNFNLSTTVNLIEETLAALALGLFNQLFSSILLLAVTIKYSLDIYKPPHLYALC